MKETIKFFTGKKGTPSQLGERVWGYVIDECYAVTLYGFQFGRRFIGLSIGDNDWKENKKDTV